MCRLARVHTNGAFGLCSSFGIRLQKLRDNRLLYQPIALAPPLKQIGDSCLCVCRVIVSHHEIPNSLAIWRDRPYYPILYALLCHVAFSPSASAYRAHKGKGRVYPRPAMNG
jgi:hypothetical protein